MEISNHKSANSPQQKLDGELGNQPHSARMLLESWWPSSENVTLLRRAHEILSDPNSSEQTAEAALEKVHSAQERMANLYLDPNQLEQFKTLSAEMNTTQSSSRKEEIYHQLNSIAYSTGLSELAPASTVIRGHQAALSIAEAIRNRDVKVNLIDLGCGDGKTGLAIPILCKNISGYLGLDCNRQAIERSQLNYLRALDQGFDLSGATVTFREGSYRSAQELSELIKIFGSEPTVFIAAFTLEGEHKIIERILPMLSMHQLLMSCGSVRVNAPLGAEAPIEQLQSHTLDLADFLKLDGEQIHVQSLRIYQPNTALAVTEYRPKLVS